jgi:hypothetical protein
VTVVHQDVLHSGFGQPRRELRFPYPLGQPKSCRFNPEPGSYGLLHPEDLLEPVFSGEGREDGFVVSGEEEFQLTVGGQTPDTIQIGGVVPFQPTQERAGQVKGEREESGRNRCREEGVVDISYVVLEDVVEVSFGLVGVKAEGEEDRRMVLISHQSETNPRGSWSVERASF